MDGWMDALLDGSVDHSNVYWIGAQRFEHSNRVRRRPTASPILLYFQFVVCKPHRMLMPLLFDPHHNYGTWMTVRFCGPTMFHIQFVLTFQKEFVMRDWHYRNWSLILLTHTLFLDTMSLNHTYFLGGIITNSSFSRYCNGLTHQQGSRDVPLAHLVERHAELHPEKRKWVDG